MFLEPPALVVTDKSSLQVCITSCVMAELEKLGKAYRIALMSEFSRILGE